MKILVFDNYDSFTYNLVHLVKKVSNAQVDVYRNDEIPLAEIKKYDKIILSPGPGVPAEAGLLLPLIREYASSKPILGVCLGHQAIGEAFGGELVNLKHVFHGIASGINIVEDSIESGKKIFKGLPARLEVGRYHSWIIREENFPSSLFITARDDNDYIMALRHKEFDVTGVQFHPESVLTPLGDRIMKNWIES
jgi:anthranilate synthase component 2